mgnify:FL=1
MELWIRSQDKKAIIKPINILLENSLDSGMTGIRGYFSFFFYKMLGFYKTEQRALEVLDEIQKKINLINLGHDFGSPMIDLKNPTYIYEMPEE